ncbi:MULTISPECIES: permease-like cell division protein FtsX [Micromonospora]|uniref:Cell division protein FtsX n=1 Tax=Micromonospora chalcea TaxID=1874 RepID=A0ABX9Y5K0_MICCH|nr:MULTISPECIES: permease-like cell division protein FtsX [Micromonospora]EWM65791.1 cell division protein FtsX [Micromonospora sp. M42]MBC8992013.1 ABC transporter permease [Micromonospora chalcea]MBQ1061538.1 permease-like cell division protein FtsX [Micromonospora sp. C41]MBQ1068653.1 permease-like cell division protein FtsX [Micromonospora sp. D75]MCK1806180.1 permease-like cell division protein FtsX [Micromonospora sp. R42106]
MRMKYVLSEVLVGLWRNVTMTIAMIITMAVSLFMLGGSGLLYQKVGDMKDLYYENVEVSIFLKTDATKEQVDALGQQLDQDPLVKDSTYVNKDQAYERFQQMYADAPDLVSAVKPDQLPESYRVKLNDPEQYKAIYDKYKTAEGIDTIVDQSKLLDKVFGVLSGFQNGALAIAMVMAVAALLLVANTIQVAAYSKRREVAVMKLVGASNWFIQAPFVLEAVVAGLFGSILGLLALIAVKVLAAGSSMAALEGLITPISWSDIFLTFPLMAAVGGVVSAVTAWVTLRFYLRV